MKSRTRQAEAIGRTNRIKAQLNRLKRHKDFLPSYGPFSSDGRPAGYLSYTHLGIEARLRYSQESDEWKATCPHFDIQITFSDQPPDDIQNILNDWLLAHIERPVSPDDYLRQCSPAVLELANRHSISPALALEIYEERGF